MALNLGDLNFGVGADTKGLDRSLAKLREFSREVDRVAKTQDAGSKTAVRGYAAQERAVKSAYQQVLNMNQQLRKAGVPPEQLARTSTAFRGLVNAMTSGKLSVVDFNRAQDAFRASMGRTARALKEFKTNEPVKQVSRFTEIIRDIESSAVLAIGPLSGLGARIRALGAITSRSSLAMAGFLGGVAATIVGISKLSNSAVSARLSMDKIEGGFMAATGSSTIAAEEFKFASDTAKSLGLDLQTTALAYSKLVAASKGTQLQGQQTRDIFKSLAVTSRALNLDIVDTERVFKAVEQIMSKGVVSSEEIRGQLGDSLPGAFNLSAEAMGVFTSQLNDMIKKGEVMSSDFLPKLSALLIKTFGDDAANAAGKLGASFERLSTVTFEFTTAFDNATGVTKKYQTIIDATTRVIEYLTNHMSDLIGVVGAVSGAFLVLFGPTIIASLVRVIALIASLTSGLLGLSSAALLNPITALPALLLRIGVAAIGATAGFLIFKNASEKMVEGNDNIIDANKRYLDSLDTTKGGIKSYTQVFIDNTKARINASKTELQALLQQQRSMEEYISAPQSKDNSVMGSIFGAADNAAKALTIAGFGALGITYESQTAQVDKLKDGIKQMEDQLKSLDQVAATTTTVPPDVGTGEGTKQLDKSIGKIKDITFEIEQLQKIQDTIANGGTPETVQAAMNMAEAAKMLADVPKEDLTAISDALAKAGYEGKTVEEALAKAIGKQNELNDSVSKFGDVADKASEAMVNYNSQLEELRNKAIALDGGTEAFNKFNKELERTKQLDQVRDSLKEVGLSQGEVNAKVIEFGVALDNIDRAQQSYDKLKEVQDDVNKAFENGFDIFGDGMLEVIQGTKSVADAFGDMATSIINDIARIVIQQSIVNPIADAAGGFLKNLGGNLLGNLFGGGSGMGKMIYSSPIGPGITGRASGGIGATGMTLVGENGPELLQLNKSSNIFPANATSRLLGGGIGSAPQVNVIINNNSGNTKASVSQSESNGIQNILIQLDEITAKNMTNPASRTNKATRALTGQRSTVGR